MNDRVQSNRPFRPLVNASRGDGVEEVEITRRDLGRKGEGAVGQRSLVVMAKVDYVVRGLDRGREGPIQMVATVNLNFAPSFPGPEIASRIRTKIIDQRQLSTVPVSWHSHRHPSISQPTPTGRKRSHVLKARSDELRTLWD